MRRSSARFTEADILLHCTQHRLPNPLPPSPHSHEPERELLGDVRKLAKRLGYLCYHTQDSRGSEPGFPDIVLTKPGRLVFVELKRAKKKPTAEQATWLSLLAHSVPGVETYVVTPATLAEFTRTLLAKDPLHAQAQ